jgi:hypothetical protein
MKREIRLTISELSYVTGYHRQTIARRLAGMEPLAGSSRKRRIYDLRLALKQIYRG